MSKESPKQLIGLWMQGRLTLQQAIGQILQHLRENEKRLERLEQVVKPERSQNGLENEKE